MRIRTCLVFPLAAVFALGAIPLRSYTPTTTGSGVQLRWPNGSLIRYTFNERFSPGNNSDLVRAAIRDAFRSLEGALPPQAGIRFEEAATTTSTNRRGCDRVNLITFTDTEDQLPPGAIAVAFFSAFETGGLASCGGMFEVTAGQIVDVDLVFNATRTFFTNVPTDGNHDIQTIALHEGAHGLGLGHSAIVSAMLYPRAVGRGAFRPRRLHSDDVAGLGLIYGASGGSISGRITTTAGAAVKGAHVVATHADTGVTTAAALSDVNGNYRIAGLAAGRYRVLAEPLDGPVDLALLDHPVFSTANTDFVSTSLTNPVTVAGGDVSAVNLQVATPSLANLDPVTFVTRTGTTFSSAESNAPFSIRRGTEASIALGGRNIANLTTQDLRFSSPRVSLRGPFTNVSINNAPGFIADLTVGADATLGSTDVSFGSSTFAGGAVITVNPQVPPNGIVDAAASNQGTLPPHYTPGSFISIFGTDLAEQTVEARSIPLPTQLGGVSVRVGNQLAPLSFVSPGQINALIPYETAGTSTEVTVVAGSQSESARVTLPLGTSAPRIFGLPPPQGAITIANTFMVAAPSGRFVIQGQSSRPAIRGQDFITIFCTGLGRVTNQPPTGVASPSSPLATTVETPAVTIGGVPATVIFSGLTPFLVGLYQVNVQVPAGAPTGDAVPVVVSVGANRSNTVNISVQ